MHELSIAHSILSIAEKSFPANSKGFISAINIQAGELSSVELEALQFAFSTIKHDTILEKAELNIEIIPGEALCADCGTLFHMNSYGTCCPDCNSYLSSIKKGKEFKISSLTVDE
ncbi:MAG: hydrogenase maturation nickel metallochaperone HypA [Bacteroidetes bacterium]|nr:hydrogenase maturation nickel metallochaperone HypA [Bacteroidota bacterium]